MAWQVVRRENSLVLKAGMLEKVISLEEDVPRLKAVLLQGENVLDAAIPGIGGNGSKAGGAGTKGVPFLDVALFLADPDEEPRGLQVDTGAAGILQRNEDVSGTDGLRVEEQENAHRPGPLEQQVSWIPLGTFHDFCSGQGNEGCRVGSLTIETVDYPASGDGNDGAAGDPGKKYVTTVKVALLGNPVLSGVTLSAIYEIVPGHDAIRKRITINNDGKHWIKIASLVIDPTSLAPVLGTKTFLTPSERGAVASIVAFETRRREKGILVCSEVPSALRSISETGVAGYSNEYFEWVLGPGEQFESEATFLYAFSGRTWKTISALSTPRDRLVEGRFKDYLTDHVGVRAIPEKMPVPLWCTWSNFHASINDEIIREQAVLASKCGFTGFQIDAGWSASDDPADWTAGSRIPNRKKFPDFKETCKFVREQGLRLGLWVSCFRNRHSPDFERLDEYMAFPPVKRGECFGMAYASKWRYRYADDILYLARTFGATYFKQDLTNIKFGDIAEGHDSRTRKESYLRAIRGFFETQDLIHEQEPDVCTLLSHELYWGTPGTPCDLAAIKHCWSFHIPPNDYNGAFPRKRRITRKETRFKWNRWPLLRGCYNARRRFYAHRGLPLYCIEYYGAATVNKDGSLTPQIQDRQVCSWLMGIPSVFAGDLSSLTTENIAHYKKRFDLVRELQEKHGIFRYFQYSGVPGPTDTGWHWWGKINREGTGIVVVLRGALGRRKRRINIPWVLPGVVYRVRSRLVDRDLGTFKGKDLQDGAICLSLPRFSQEILELSRITPGLTELTEKGDIGR